VAVRRERVQLAVHAPRIPGPQVVEVGAARLLAPALDKERGDEPPERIGVEVERLPSSLRGSRSTAAAGSSGAAGSANGAAAGRTTSTSSSPVSLTAATLDGGCDGSRSGISPRFATRG